MINKSTLENSPPPLLNLKSLLRLDVKNAKNDNKSAILHFYPAIIELVPELVISNMHNRFEDDT